ncbi:MAG: flagellar basal body-associated protein FliL [Thermodesulfobacteriota bacterium]
MAKEKEKEPESPPSEEPTPKPKRSLKKIIFLALGATILCAGAFFGYLIIFDDPAASGKAAEEKAKAERVVMPLDAFLVNLADKETRRYLKVKVELEVENEKALKELEKSVPRMRDTMILLLSSKNYADISTLEGKIKLKEEIMKKLAALPGGKKVNGAYFTEFVAQ